MSRKYQIIGCLCLFWSLILLHFHDVVSKAENVSKLRLLLVAFFSNYSDACVCVRCLHVTVCFSAHSVQTQGASNTIIIFQSAVIHSYSSPITQTGS